MSSKVIFLTGASGFLGAEILHRVLVREPETSVICLVRGTSTQEAQERVVRALAQCREGMTQAVQIQHERLLIVNGDITFPRFGLSPLVYSLLQRRTTHVLHNAASTRFDLSLEEARSINVGGTLEVLRFARGCDNLDRLGYVSTAYVAGDREGIVREDELNVGQGFLNTYEQSKTEAEALIHEAMATGLPRTMIFRPSIIMGDSRDGRSTTFKMLYCPMRLYSLGVIREVPGKPWVRLDVVPINYVADAVHRLFADETALGKTFHLVAGPERSMSLQAFVERGVEICNEHLASRGLTRRMAVPQIIDDSSGPGILDRAIESMPSGQMRSLFEMFRFFVPYTQKDKMFDDRNTRMHLTETGLAPMPFAGYMHRILSYCFETSWGRKPRERESLEAEVWLEGQLERVFCSSS
jgi:long-chain acyl-CoA synthetase